MESVGPPFGNSFVRCNIVRISRVDSYEFLVLLIFELGQYKPSPCSHVCSFGRITAIVILTIKRGFHDCVSSSSLT